MVVFCSFLFSASIKKQQVHFEKCQIVDIKWVVSQGFANVVYCLLGWNLKKRGCWLSFFLHTFGLNIIQSKLSYLQCCGVISWRISCMSWMVCVDAQASCLAVNSSLSTSSVIRFPRSPKQIQILLNGVNEVGCIVKGEATLRLNLSVRLSVLPFVTLWWELYFLDCYIRLDNKSL